MERLHPFDSRKYGRAWKQLQRRIGKRLDAFRVTPYRPAARDDLLRFHTSGYLQRLRDPKFIAKVVELPPLRHLPGGLLDWAILRPMRWATAGTVLAAREAMAHGLAVNLAGGYHHASPDHGHGFSAYADVGLAILELRRTSVLRELDNLAYIDLDAHQGNGVCRTFASDPRVMIYDQYNEFIFPCDVEARRRIDCDVPLPRGCGEADYLHALQMNLPRFLDSITRDGKVRLAVYNAGTDVYTGDRLGGLNVSARGVLRRDQFVLDGLIARKIPTVVVLSGGYSRESYAMVADMVGYVIERWGATALD
jgi:histone deacetylase 11